MNKNPYNWTGHHPVKYIYRSQLDDAVSSLQRGDGAYLLAGRGMGKSVFLKQLASTFSEYQNIRVCRFPGPPLQLTVENC